MTILQRSTFSGTAHQNVRPGAYTKTTTVEGIVKDQAYLYERITGLAVPNAAGASATPHNHSGGGAGALVRIPLGQGYCGISMPRRDDVPLDNKSDDASGFARVLQLPFFAPEGVTSVRLVLWSTPQTATSLVAVSYDSGLSTALSSPVWSGPQSAWLRAGGDEALQPLSFEPLPVNEGEVNFIVVSAWDGYYDQTSRNAVASSTQEADFPLLPDGRFISCWEILPVSRGPNDAPSVYAPPTSTSAALSLPSSFTSFDSAQIADDVGLSGYHLVSINQNDGVLQELSTGNPAGAETSATMDAHNHAGGSSLSACGIDIDHCLGVWFYGNVKPAARDGSGTTVWDDADCISTSTPNIWTGGVSSYVLTASSGSGYHTVAEHKVRIPAAISANLANTTGRIKGRALVYNVGSAANVSVQASIGDSDTSNYGTTKSATTSTSGRVLLSLDGIQMTSNSATSSGDHLATLKIELAQASGLDRNCHLLAFCLYYEAA